MSDNAAGIYKEDFTMPEQIDDKKLKQQIARLILEALHEWFEVEESREKYISECANWIFFAAKEAINTPDFCALKKQEKKQ